MINKQILAKHHSHSLPGEPKIGMISRLELQEGTTATHILEAKDRHDQQAKIAARQNSHSHPGEPRIEMVSRLKLQQQIMATYFLESQGQT